MIVSEVATFFLYALSLAFLPEYFGACLILFSYPHHKLTRIADLAFVTTFRFAWKVGLIVAVSAFPLYIFKLIRSRIRPSTSSKLL